MEHWKQLELQELKDQERSIQILRENRTKVGGRVRGRLRS